MRLYHYGNKNLAAAPAEDREAENRRFFSESLTDYLAERGRDIPESLKRGEPPALRKGPHGKPYLAEPGLEEVFFSLSHTRGHAIVCFSAGEIGADCENTEAREGRTGYAGIAARCFMDDERAYTAIGEPGFHTRFFEIWTAKEAYMKYTGKGFAEGFRSFSVLSAPGVCIETGRLAEAPGVVFSVCTAAESPRIAAAGADAFFHTQTWTVRGGESGQG